MMSVPRDEHDVAQTKSSVAPDDERDPLDEFAEDFLQRRQRGEHPSVDDYVARLPHRKGEIIDLLSALAFVENVKSDADATMEAMAPKGDRGEERSLERLGDYRILREVGRGGMGIVYEAEQESLGRHVALKVLARRSLIGTEQVQRFLREARSAAQLHHSNIVPVFFVGEHDGLHYYVMQFIRGLGLDAVLEEVRRLRIGPAADHADLHDAETHIGDVGVSASELAHSLVGGPAVELQNSVKKSGFNKATPLSDSSSQAALSSASASGAVYARTVARIGRQVADALAYAHKQGVLHRDIKPSNLLLDAQGNTWVTDFGLAKATEDDDLTRTGDLVGTLRYMAPERFRGCCDARSDIYAVGLTLYELLAHRPAFSATERDRLIYEVTQTNPPRLKSLVGGLPRDLETIIEKAIAREPAHRYQTAGALARDLERFLDDRPIEARRASTTERLARWARRNPGLTTLGGTIVALLIVIAIGSIFATININRKHSEALAAVHASQEKLWEAYLAQAKASRRGDSPGRRFSALQYLRQAAALKVYQDRRALLRDEAIASFALSDLVPGRRYRSDEIDPTSPTAFDSRMERYAYANLAGEVILRSTKTQAELSRFSSGSLKPVHLRFSPSGRFLAVKADHGGRTGLAVFDSARHELIHAVPEGAFENALDFSPDENWIAAGRRDGTVVLYDLNSNGHSRRLTKGVTPAVLRFEPSGERLAVAGQTTVEIRRLEDGQILQTIGLPTDAKSMDWSPSATSLAIGGADGRIFVVDLLDPMMKPRTLEGHYGPVVTLDHHPTSCQLASASWDGTLRLWDLPTGRQVIQTPIAEAERIQFSDDGTQLGPGRDGKHVWQWSVLAGRECLSLVNASGPVDATWSVDFLPRWGLLVTAGAPGLRFDAPELNRQFQAPALPGTSSIAFTPKGRVMITGGQLGLRKWPVRLDQDSVLRIGPSEPFGLPAGLPTDRIRLAPDGDTLAVVTDWERGRGVIFRLSQPGVRVPIEGHPGVERLAFSEDSRWLATGTWKGTDVRVWDTRSGKLEVVLPVEGSADMGFSPDGKTLITASGSIYQLWKVGAWEPGVSLKRWQAGSQPGKLEFSSDGRMLAITRSRDIVQVVDPTTFEVLATLEPPHPQHVASLGFSSDGSSLAVTYNTRMIHHWDLRSVWKQLSEMELHWEQFPIATSELEQPVVPRSVVLEVPEWLNQVAVADAYVASNQWDEALAAYANTIKAGNRDPQHWSQLAKAYLFTGQPEEYRRECRAMRAHFGNDIPPIVANQIAWTCSLGPDATSDPDGIVRLVRSAVRGNRDHARLNTLGAALCRAGRYQEAVDVLNQGIVAHGSGGVAQDWLLLAQAYIHLDRLEEAKRFLNQVDARSEQRRASDSAWERLEIDILYKEVSALIATTQ